MIVGRCGIGMDGWMDGGFACRAAAADRLKGAEARACVRGRQRRPIFCPGNKLRQSERVRFPRWSLKMQLTKKPQPAPGLVQGFKNGWSLGNLLTL